MIRIYLDKQIYSYLWKSNQSVYKKLLSSLYKYKNSLLYCYSHAHLLDLKNDNTDKKYHELDFMETLVGNNYLSYHVLKKYTTCYLATPREAFQEIEKEEPISFDNLFDIDSSNLTQEQGELLTKLKELFNVKMDFGFPNVQGLPKEVAQLKKIFPEGASSITLLGLSKHFLGLTQRMQEDKSMYKELRSITDKYINNGKFTVEFDKIDFNEDLKNSALQKSFIEYVNENLNQNGSKEITNYDFFSNAYFTLDLLGISKEKNAAFRNIMNDGLHGYYGAYCDYVISNDNGFLKKVRAMYKLLGIKTTVLNIDEFIQVLPMIGNNDEQSIDIFGKLLANDLKNSFVESMRHSLIHDRDTTAIKPSHTYLGYFNQIEIIRDNKQEFLVLSRQTHNYSGFYFYKEIQSVVNRALKVFGMDTQFKGSYDWVKENEEISKHVWRGRSWKYNGLKVLLEINKGPQKLTLWITLA